MENSKGPEVSPHGTFKTKIGLVLSCVGCMVGTGNIWRFPRILANNSGSEGCLQFLIVWVFFLFMWSIPVVIIEYGLGRFTKNSTIMAFSKMIGAKFAWCGGWAALVAAGISSYYAVVLGWCFYYSIIYLYTPLPENVTDSKAVFDSFAVESAFPVLFHFLAMGLAGASVAWGVKSIEIVNTAIVPVFLLLILISFVWSLFLDDAMAGLKFMFSADWAEFSNARMWVDAISQNAFDTGAASGLMVTYATFMTSKHSIVKYGTLIPIGNNIISLLCGMLTFSTVFSTQIQLGKNTTEIVAILQENGPANTGLTFIWFPIFYSQMKGGRFLAIIFFFSLSMAGFSSLIANVEMAVHNLEDLGIQRQLATIVSVSVITLFGLGSALSLEFLVSQDFTWGFGLLISGLFFLFMVIKYGARKYRETLFNEYSETDWKLSKVWEFIIKFVAPTEGVFLIVWWAVDTISSSTATHPWYGYSPESFMATVTEWVGFLLLLLLINFLGLKYYRNIWYPDEDQQGLTQSERDSLPITRETREEDTQYNTFNHDDLETTQ